MARLNWNRGKRAKQAPKKKTRTKAVHPNSTAARVWGRKSWRSTQ